MKTIRKLLKEKSRAESDYGVLYNPPQFRRILERERALADRNGQGFSLLTFEVNGLRSRIRRMRKLVLALSEKIRLSDEIGWFEEDQLGVILPQTSPQGASVLAERVRRETASPDWPAQYSIYCYPSPDGQGGPKEPPAPSGRRREGQLPQESDDDRPVSASPEKPNGLEPYLTPPVPTWKRGLDIAGALAGLIVTAPLLGLITLLIKLSSPGPVFFKQQRVGFMKQPFTLWKFRTMHVDSGEGLHRQHWEDLMGQEKAMTKLDAGQDPRVIPGGRFLRRFGLDELPQLVNILRGEMSLVGPRPCLPYEAEQYDLWHTRRFDMLPGLTGLWQVNGKNRTTFRQMIRMDISYLKQRTLKTDLQIAFKTVPAIMSQNQRSARRGGD